MAINVPQNYCTCFAPHHGCSTEFAVVRIKGTDLMLVSAAGMPAAPNFPDSVFSASAAKLSGVAEPASASNSTPLVEFGIWNLEFIKTLDAKEPRALLT